MAELKKIEIKDFRGVQHTSVEFEANLPEGRFVSLIGLNESGKTTILEAIAFSALADEDTVDLFDSVQGKPELNDIIPKRHKSSFSGEISIKLTVCLGEADKAAITSYLRNIHNFMLAPGETINDIISIKRSYQYTNSKYQKTNTIWDFDPRVVKVTGYKVGKLSQYSSGQSEWHSTVRFLKTRCPRIVYFPTFLVEFPSRIYLEGDHGVSDKYFRGVIDDALKSLEKRLTITDHIIGRVNVIRKNLGEASLGSALRSSPDGQNIDATVQELTAELNYVIFGAWNDIFGKKVTNKRINVEWHIDESSKEIYLEIYIVEGKYRYYIGERSLGFRWFFSFLLFTQFSTFRNKDSKVLYLFDEPASNLHAKAQQRLLESFKKIAYPDHSIIYSTHSQYMVNPLWLEKAFIVENKASRIEDDDMSVGYAPRDTDIVAIRYRQFVNDNPTRTTYFQPALDALDYCIDQLSLGGKALILEGKYDYFSIKYLFDSISPDLFKIYPAGGASTMGAIISLLRGWGVPFLVLLDDDTAGHTARKNYIADFLLEDSQVATLGQLIPSLKGQTLEGIFKDDVISAVKSSGISKGNPTKSDFYLFFQSLLNGSGEKPKLPQTLQVAKRLQSAIIKRLDE